ncbi:MAG: hypothetical protein H6711_20300 [Myxococcales bacterium]|nr:hypothetical protein [Myxococcales bacterium]
MPRHAAEERPSSLVKHPRVRDQGEVGCCVSISITGAVELLLRPPGGEPPELSPMFHYYMARPRGSRLHSLSIAEGLSSAVRDGICPQALHPQPITPAGAAVPPSDAAIAAARELAGTAFNPALGFEESRLDYRSVDGRRRGPAWREALAAGWPILVGIWLTAGYRAITRQRPIHGADLDGRQSVGHAVLCVGYDPARGFRIVDVKGERFGERGTWWMPTDLAEGPLVHESWTLRPR